MRLALSVCVHLEVSGTQQNEGQESHRGSLRTVDLPAMKSLEGSIIEILADLGRWAGFPKYALERRLDIFLSRFIPQALTARIGKGAQVEIVTAEFPIRHGTNYQTVNADYLLFRRDEPTWFLVELKTDRTSVDPEQLRLYLEASARTPFPMKQMVEELPEIRKHARRRARKEKYANLITHLESWRKHLRAPVEVVYVSPVNVKGVTTIRLAELAELKPANHVALWTHLQPVVAKLAADSDPGTDEAS